MKGIPYSVILLPTLKCDADCDYCFERKSAHRLTLDGLSVVIRKVMEHLEHNHLETLSIYWQGGEVMTLPPEWFDEANGLIRKAADGRNIHVLHYLQSNMIAYTAKWNPVIAGMFGNSVGSSMDFPNLHRKLKSGGPKEYERVWTRNVRQAIDAGIQVGVIAIPNEQTLEMGAERFYSYFADELGITDFQINTPFPGGSANDVKAGYPLNTGRLSGFLADLATIWMERGVQGGVRVGPFDKLLDYFVRGGRNLLCIWRDNCANDFVCIDPQGWVAQCDCWVASYPEFHFGNLFDDGSLTDLLDKSEARRRLQARPGVLIRHEGCLDCHYLTLCHGGCPVRAYTIHGDIFRKDPYCELYLSLFRHMEMLAVKYPRAAEGFVWSCPQGLPP